MISFLLSLALSNPDFIVIVDNKFPSQILKSEIERDWGKYEGLEKFEEIQCQIFEKVNLHIVKNDNLDEIKKYRIPRVLKKYPCYKFGIYNQDYYEFDERSFNASGTPIRAVKYIVDKYFYEEELKKWNDSCVRLHSKALTYNTKVIYDFLIKYHQDAMYAYFYGPCLECYDFDIVSKVELEYSNDPNLPFLWKPVMPDKPALNPPWRE